MFRFRRYRVFIAVAVFILLSLFHFKSARNWEGVRNTSVEKIQHWTGANVPSEDISPPKEKPQQGYGSSDEDVSSQQTKQPLQDEVIKPKTSIGGSEVSTTLVVQETGADTSTPMSILPTVTLDEPKENLGAFEMSAGKGRHEVPLEGEDLPIIHWTKLPEHFPIPSESVIPLPTGAPKKLPTIQYAFGKESENAKSMREQKLIAIKQAFNYSWEGYRKHAWMHDELAPVSGQTHDPFCHWAATLVDSLDTLWIMGMEEEFIEAVNAVETIDFTTSPRKDIPVFETTIRYLGGLLSAYDVSGHKYPVLLNKAVELAEVLMGAFDTPNRLPIMYYLWRPTFAVNPHRSETRVVMAEIGSLAIEFTRLAQLTKDSKYYDAIARITNEFDNWQDRTKIPGLWPKTVDASGCRKPEISNSIPGDQAWEDESREPWSSFRLDSDVDLNTDDDATPSEVEISESLVAQRSNSSESKDNVLHRKRQDNIGDDDYDTIQQSPGTFAKSMKQPGRVDCEPQGLTSPPGSYSETFTLGALADSTYEYLPKQYMLLGGQVPQYRIMYEKAAAAANENLIYRPMVPDGRDILIAGSVDATDSDGVHKSDRITAIPEHTHLTCFVGGMFGIGAKLFGREADLDLAIKLTDGCVWSYEATKTGIMPESMKLIPCVSRKSCPWNETLWGEEVDPYRAYRESVQQDQLLAKETAITLAGKEYEHPDKTRQPDDIVELKENQDTAEVSDPERLPEANATDRSNSTTVTTTPRHEERDTELNSERKADSKGQYTKRQLESDDIDRELRPTMTQNGLAGFGAALNESEEGFITHEEYVRQRIEEEQLPIGIPQVLDSRYILRPEAIESVFIMYRITGDAKWREKGWNMFKAITKHTKTNYGYSAIGDVRREDSSLKDSMESFWTAETLKYFFLLFSTEDTISLDEYVFNTEAHPMKRPKPVSKS